MIYRDSKGYPTLSPSDTGWLVVEAEIMRIQNSIKIIEQRYECINPEQLDKLRAMAGHLMAMVSDE
jgi:hypothetical protein